MNAAFYQFATEDTHALGEEELAVVYRLFEEDSS
jgi:hypothetical protein